MDGIGFRYKRLFTWKPVPRAAPAEITLHDSDEVMILPDPDEIDRSSHQGHGPGS
jgi:hypothetical protein